MNLASWTAGAVRERRSEMKKQKTAVKKLRIGKETLLPLGSRQMNQVAGGTAVTEFAHAAPSEVFHI
jgi:hypothetical protein